MDFLLVIAALMAANLASVAIVAGVVYAMRNKIKAQLFSDAGFLIAQASQEIEAAISQALAAAQQPRS